LKWKISPGKRKNVVGGGRGRTLFSSVFSFEGRSSASQLCKNWHDNERRVFFCLSVSEANLLWGKIYHSVNFIMFRFALGKEQTVSLLYNHTPGLPTCLKASPCFLSNHLCHPVLTFFLLTICKAGKSVPFLMKILIAKCLFDQKDTEPISNKKEGCSFDPVLLEGLLVVQVYFIYCKNIYWKKRNAAQANSTFGSLRIHILESEVSASRQEAAFVMGSKLFTHMVSTKDVLLDLCCWLGFRRSACAWV